MIEFYKPSLQELWFREELLNDEATMAYNHHWGGTIPFPREIWARWYKRWFNVDETVRYYRYILDTDINKFVGEVSYHYEEQRAIYLMDVIVKAEYRFQGIGTTALRMLIEVAKENGLSILHDDIAKDNLAVELFRSEGFYEDYSSEYTVMLKKPVAVFDSERLYFTRLSREYLDDYLNMINDYENVGSMIGKNKEIITRDQEIRFIQNKLENKDKVFSMIDKSDCCFVGNIEFMRFDTDSAYLGIAVTAAKQNMGFGKEGINRFLKYGHEAYGLNEVFLDVYKKNPRAMHVYEECGFEVISETDNQYKMKKNLRQLTA